MKQIMPKPLPNVRSVFEKEQRTEEERLYFGMIDRAMDAREYRIISNGKPGHAVYLIHKMLTAAQEDIKILTGNLSRTVGDIMAYGDPQICNDAVGLLKRGCSLDILVADKVDVEPGATVGSHPLLKALSDSGFANRVNLAEADSEVFEAMKWQHHFLLMDKMALRIETDANKAEALVNFNDKKLGMKLHRMFDSWLADARRLDWHPAAAT